MLVENLMVNDDHWAWQEREMAVEKIVGRKGYREAETNMFVPEDEAYVYALAICLDGTEEDRKEFKKMLVEWFYSGGNWRRE